MSKTLEEKLEVLMRNILTALHRSGRVVLYCESTKKGIVLLAEDVISVHVDLKEGHVHIRQREEGRFRKFTETCRIWTTTSWEDV